MALYALSNIQELYIPDQVSGPMGLTYKNIKLNISPNNRNYVRQGPALYTAAFDTLVHHEASPSRVVVDLRCNYVNTRYCDFHDADTLVFPGVTHVDGGGWLKSKILYYGKYATSTRDNYMAYSGVVATRVLPPSMLMAT